MTTLPLNINEIWPLIYAILQEYWAITDPYIERAADQNNIPIELYYYSELGLTYFSVTDFQKRDPYTNPERFENAFTRLEFKGWIYPDAGDRYQVSRKAQDAVRQIVGVGDMQLKKFAMMTDIELDQLANSLKKIIEACLNAPEPPEKWAVSNRFSPVDESSPPIAQVRDALMYLHAYHDDSHFSAAHSHFGGAGILWSVLGYLWKNEATTASQMTKRMAFRGYDKADYEVALQAAVEIGWAELGDTPEKYRPTQMGITLRKQVDQQTEVYFSQLWSVLSERELWQLHASLKKLHELLILFRNSGTLVLRDNL